MHQLFDRKGLVSCQPHHQALSAIAHIGHMALWHFLCICPNAQCGHSLESLAGAEVITFTFVLFCTPRLSRSSRILWCWVGCAHSTGEGFLAAWCSVVQLAKGHTPLRYCHPLGTKIADGWLLQLKYVYLLHVCLVPGLRVKQYPVVHTASVHHSHVAVLQVSLLHTHEQEPWRHAQLCSGLL
jgi:hypothetical protein